MPEQFGICKAAGGAGTLLEKHFNRRIAVSKLRSFILPALLAFTLAGCTGPGSS